MMRLGDGVRIIVLPFTEIHYMNLFNHQTKHAKFSLLPKRKKLSRDSDLGIEKKKLSSTLVSAAMLRASIRHIATRIGVFVIFREMKM